MTTQNFLDQFPTKEQVDNFISSANSTLKTISENQQSRMENYYNCIDDYSYGGICDKASDQHRNWLNHAIQTLKEQLESGKPEIKDFHIELLCDLNGNIVSDRIVNGRFGPCWIIKDGENVSFVSCLKTQKTYNKKGFKIMRKIYETEFYFLAASGKNGLKTKQRVISERTEDTDDVAYANTKLDTIAWLALNN